MSPNGTRRRYRLGQWWGLDRDVLVPLMPVLAGWLTVALSAVALLAVLTVLFPRTGGDEP